MSARFLRRERDQSLSSRRLAEPLSAICAVYAHFGSLARHIRPDAPIAETRSWSELLRSVLSLDAYIQILRALS